MDNEKFGKFVAMLRKEKNMTQKDLADKLQITNKAISKWERGISFPDITMLKPLADSLDISVAELINCERGNKNETDIDEKTRKILDDVYKSGKKKDDIIAKISVSIFIIIAFIIMVVSYSLFATINPIRALCGYIWVEILNQEYMVVQNLPIKVIYGNENSFSLTEYMAERGYIELKNEQMGLNHVYLSNEHIQGVLARVPMAKKDIPFSVYKFTEKDKVDENKRKNLIANELKTEDENLEVVINFNNEISNEIDNRVIE